MIAGTPDQSRWLRPEPRRAIPSKVLQEIVSAALPGGIAVDAQPLVDGLRNANFRIQLESPPTFLVVRLYEHDPSLCQKELDLLNLIRNSVPVAEIIHAEPNGINETPPFMVLSYVEGVTFRELKHSGNAESIAQAAHDSGRILALIGGVEFPRSGWLGPGPSVTAPLLEGADSGPRFVNLCLSHANVQQRMTPRLRDRVSATVWSFAPQLAILGREARLVHGDFGNRNILVRRIAEKWAVTAVLDWEFAIAGSPLTDVGHFLRYETSSQPRVEPHFSRGFTDAGGELPHGWRRLARIVDLIALCESLTHDALSSAVAAELIELVAATVEDRDPHLF